MSDTKEFGVGIPNVIPKDAFTAGDEEAKKPTVGLFDEGSEGVSKSMMRFGFFVCISVAILTTFAGLAAYLIILAKSADWKVDATQGQAILDALFPYVTVFLIVAFTGKSVQKLFEMLPQIMTAIAAWKAAKK